MNLKKQFEDHPVGSVIIVALICISGTWLAYEATLGKIADRQLAERDREISQLKEKVSQQQVTMHELEERCPRQSARILEPTWLLRKSSISILDGQVLLRVEEVYPALRGVAFALEIPSKNTNYITVYSNARQTFEYKEGKYFIEIHEIESDRAKIAVTKQV